MRKVDLYNLLAQYAEYEKTIVIDDAKKTITAGDDKSLKIKLLCGFYNDKLADLEPNDEISIDLVEVLHKVVQGYSETADFNLQQLDNQVWLEVIKLLVKQRDGAKYKDYLPSIVNDQEPALLDALEEIEDEHIFFTSGPKIYVFDSDCDLSHCIWDTHNKLFCNLLDTTHTFGENDILRLVTHTGVKSELERLAAKFETQVLKIGPRKENTLPPQLIKNLETTVKALEKEGEDGYENAAKAILALQGYIKSLPASQQESINNYHLLANARDAKTIVKFAELINCLEKIANTDNLYQFTSCHHQIGSRLKLFAQDLGRQNKKHSRAAQAHIQTILRNSAALPLIQPAPGSGKAETPTSARALAHSMRGGVLANGGQAPQAHDDSAAAGPPYHG